MFQVIHSLTRRCALSVAAFGVFVVVASAQEIDPTTGITYPQIGKIPARSAHEIGASSWSIGAETLDRGFGDYAKYKEYLGPLGAKSVRLQAGWARCEPVKGVYSWDWLDAVVNDVVAQGVRPWLELSYGNTLYQGGGDTGLGGGFPSSPDGLAAWDRWCRALVERYRDRVNQWEVWNEPDLNRDGTAESGAYVDLYIRTASLVRGVQPEAKVWALALAHNADYADRFLQGMQARGKLDLIDALTFHGYPRNPDDTVLVDRLRALVARHGRAIELRQGETGAPSQYQTNFALRDLSWTETTQAKWDLRRLLAHHAKDVPMNLFTLADLHYTTASAQGGADGVLRMNYKGLVATNADQTVSHVKAVYRAVQTVFTVFDDSLTRIPVYPFASTSLRAVAASGYRRADNGAQVVAYWWSDAPPADANGVSLIDLTLTNGTFTDPVLVDVRTSTVYALPRKSWSQGKDGAKFTAMPIYDSPVLIAERSALILQ